VPSSLEDCLAERLKPGQHPFEFAYKYDVPGPCKGGTRWPRWIERKLARRPITPDSADDGPCDETFDVGSIPARALILANSAVQVARHD